MFVSILGATSDGAIPQPQALVPNRSTRTFQEGRRPREHSDEAAKRIRDKFADAPENPVRFRRVRATAGNLVHKSLLECIDNKDIVIGHLASLDRSALVVAAPHGPEAEGPSRTRTESAALSRSRGISDPLVNRLESAPRAR